MLIQCIVFVMAAGTHLAYRNIPIRFLGSPKEMQKGPQGKGSHPGSFYKVRLGVEIVMNSDLGEIARHVCTARQEDL